MKIGEFSKLVGLPISTLRYYEEQGFLHIGRINGIRNYQTEDIGFVQFIRRLKEMGMPLSDIRTYAHLRYAGKETVAKRMELLKTHYQHIESEIQKYEKYKDNLDNKLRLYERMLSESESSE